MDDREALARSRTRRGEIVGKKYVLTDVLGVGGMGIVYVAVQRSLERTVAVKVPRPELVDDQLVKYLFRREALTSSRISHRNVVCTLDYGHEDGIPYVVMEHIVGPRLSQLLHETGTLPLATALELVRQIVAGLADAHSNGIVHADVKCDNVLVQTQRDGSVVPRLIDFGIARFIDERMPAPPHQEAFVTGTPEYVAPEVARGQRPMPPSDVYALGVMLYELVTGTAPIGGDDASAIMSRKLESEPVPMRQRCPGITIPTALDALVSRMLARDPAQRPADARELAGCLADIDAGGGRSPASAAITAPIFSTEGRTASMGANQTVKEIRPKASLPSLADQRLRVVAAIKGGNVDRIATEYLALARVLLERQQVQAAQAELEEGIELLMTPSGRGPVWRLLLSLASLYEHRGDHASARLVARAARDRATEAGSLEGRARSARMCARLR